MGDEHLTAIDDLIDALSASGIPFQRDAWWDVNNSLDNEDYGVVELTGAPVTLWGDNQLIEQHIQGNVVLYVHDGADDKAKSVQDILKSLDVGFALTGTEYLMAENKNRWMWRFNIDRYLNG